MRIRATKKTGTGKIGEGYWVEGVLLGPLETGYPLRILRDTKNGEPCLGMLTTSEVRGFNNEGDVTEVITANSVWELVEV